MEPEQDAPPHGSNLGVGRWSEHGHAYHITKCRLKSATTSLANDDVASVIIDSIRWHQVHGHTHLLAFVVMADHVHWLFVLGGGRPLSDVMRGFSSYTATQVNRPRRPAGPLWQEGFHDHQIRKGVEQAMEVIRYIHENPVRRGLCTRAEEWMWSTANPRYEGWIEREWLW